MPGIALRPGLVRRGDVGSCRATASRSRASTSVARRPEPLAQGRPCPSGTWRSVGAGRSSASAWASQAGRSPQSLISRIRAGPAAKTSPGGAPTSLPTDAQRMRAAEGQRSSSVMRTRPHSAVRAGAPVPGRSAAAPWSGPRRCHARTVSRSASADSGVRSPRTRRSDLGASRSAPQQRGRGRRQAHLRTGGPRVLLELQERERRQHRRSPPAKRPSRIRATAAGARAGRRTTAGRQVVGVEIGRSRVRDGPARS